MAYFQPGLDDRLRAFIQEQKVFFTASAPPHGRINLSPKGMDSFRCLDARTVAYLDLTGSGNETAAHVLHNGRLTIMFCAFEGDPLILRLYGRGRVVSPAHPDWAGLIEHFEDLPGRRQIIVLELDSVQTSCGFGVPEYRYLGERERLLSWAQRQGPKGLARYREQNNRSSIDGLPIEEDGG